MRENRKSVADMLLSICTEICIKQKFTLTTYI